MSRPFQFSLRSMFLATTFVAVACVVGPKPVRHLWRRLFPPQTCPCAIGGMLPTPEIIIAEEDESLLAIPETDPQ